jgi:hypothetical protein
VLRRAGSAVPPRVAMRKRRVIWGIACMKDVARKRIERRPWFGIGRLPNRVCPGLSSTLVSAICTVRACARIGVSRRGGCAGLHPKGTRKQRNSFSANGRPTNRVSQRREAALMFAGSAWPGVAALRVSARCPYEQSLVTLVDHQETSTHLSSRRNRVAADAYVGVDSYSIRPRLGRGVLAHRFARSATVGAWDYVVQGMGDRRTAGPFISGAERRAALCGASSLAPSTCYGLSVRRLISFDLRLPSHETSRSRSCLGLMFGPSCPS